MSFAIFSLNQSAGAAGGGDPINLGKFTWNLKVSSRITEHPDLVDLSGLCVPSNVGF